MKTVLQAKGEPFVYWRRASLAATVVAVAFGFAHRDSLMIGSAVMAIGWALCDIIAWRDWRNWNDALVRLTPMQTVQQSQTLCPTCGDPYISIPRLGIGNICSENKA